MVEYRKKSAPIDVTAEQPKKIVSMEYDGYTCLIKTKQESPASMQLEVEKEEELPYLDLDFKEESIVQAMVYSEIFGKPKSKRKRRW